MTPAQSAKVRLGLCAWTDKGLIDLWYPKGATPEARLRFYAEHFDVVEVNSSYYAIPEPGAAAKWVARTPDGFIFHVKAFGYMTGHRVLPEQLPPDLRPLVERVSNRGFVEPTAELTRRVFSRFREAAEPLRQAGKLGGILMQYGPTFRPSPESEARIEADRDRLAGLEMLIEFRHVDWLAAERREETLALVRRLGLTYVAVDAPAVSSPNVAQTVVRATSSTAYVRFHGRNAGSWNSRGPTASDRFDHYYTEGELGEWVEPLRELTLSGVARVYAMFNTNNADQGPRNAAMLRRLLREGGVAVAPAPGSDQPGLF